MTAAKLLNSNITELRVAIEQSIKVLPGSPVFNLLDPNSYSNFGGEIKTLARAPIRSDRQTVKGVTVGLSAAGDIECDFTYSAMRNVLPSFFYANFHTKGEFGGASQITAVTSSTFTAASGLTIFPVGSLVFAAGFSKVLGNNGLHRVTTSIATTLTVAETMIAEAAPPAIATLVSVGFQSAAGDLDVNVSGPLPVVTTTAFNPVTAGILAGEWVYFGDDTNALFSFSNAANNGWKRVRSVTSTSITIDKTTAPMVVETNTTQTVRIYYGRVLQNETGTNIVRTTLQFERTLGAPDDASPTQVQSEYILGAVGNQLDFDYKVQDKLTCNLSFVACDVEQRTGVTGVKSGTRPALPELPAFNTSSSVQRINLGTVTNTNVAVTPLAGAVLNLKMSIKNNVKGIAVIGTLGYFELVAGDFTVEADMEALFLTVAAQNSVRNNADVTLDIIQVVSNTAMVMDMPLLTLGDGRAKVTKDDPITIPLSAMANSGEQIDAGLDHTLLMSFFDYVPNVASTLI